MAHLRTIQPQTKKATGVLACSNWRSATSGTFEAMLDVLWVQGVVEFLHIQLRAVDQTCHAGLVMTYYIWRWINVSL